MAFTFDSLQPEPHQDTQLMFLTNALTRYCDVLEEDRSTATDDRNIITRLVVWRYGGNRFRAKLVTLDGEASIGQYEIQVGARWQRLPNPRALAERLNQAKSTSELNLS
jgi:hypothetical protein